MRPLTIAKNACLGYMLSSAACAYDTREPLGQGAGLELTPATDPSDPCQRGTIEPDLIVIPWSGPGVSFREVMPGDYIVSSTYLRLRHTDAASSKFWELMLPIFDELESHDGLLALSLALSLDCNTARTLSVWRDDVAMLDFTTSPAHAAAVAAITELSRGGSIVTHWTGPETQATWQNAAENLGKADGPFY